MLERVFVPDKMPFNASISACGELQSLQKIANEREITIPCEHVYKADIIT